MAERIFAVHHLAFATDDLKWTTTYVEAHTKEEALVKFNEEAKKRRKYPYMWEDARLENVHLVVAQIK
jgi:hypothetical protein